MRRASRPIRLGSALSALLLLGSLAASPATVAGGGPGVAAAPAHLTAGPIGWLQESTYYSGYSTYLRAGTFSRVTGTWVVPTATCHGATSVSAAWVGLDDAGAKFLEQAGTFDYCPAGSLVPQYLAWTEMFPKPSVISPLVVRAGDTIRTTVSASGSTYTFRIENLTTHHTFRTTASQPHAARLAAYWIVEAPWTGATSARLYPLTQFKPFTIKDAKATANGRTGTIGSALWDMRLRWTMRDGRTLKATVGALTSAGSRFRITWHHR